VFDIFVTSTNADTKVCRVRTDSLCFGSSALGKPRLKHREYGLTELEAEALWDTFRPISWGVSGTFPCASLSRRRVTAPIERSSPSAGRRRSSIGAPAHIAGCLRRETGTRRQDAEARPHPVGKYRTSRSELALSV
jgi:hypothetical protein